MAASFDQIDDNWLRRFRRNLKTWYQRSARDFPWRRSSDPYPIWISEIMLQQTTVSAVVPYFERFLARFPHVVQLARASETDLLRHWEGLGYYSRARNIHKTAKRIVQQFDGRFPEDVAGLIKLPGIGRYTAGAIASFAFDRRAPILEANTLRLFSRLLGFRDDPYTTAGQKTLWAFAERILPTQSVGTFNQALMELGGTICTPSQPECTACPVRSCCAAFAQGAQDEIPRPKPRAKITAVTEAAIAIRRNTRYLLLERPDGQRWAGLWDFPRFGCDRLVNSHREEFKLTSGRSVQFKSELAARVLDETGLKVHIGDLVTQIRHSVTRYRIRLLCFAAKSIDAVRVDSPLKHAWVAPEQWGNYPLSVTGRKFAEQLELYQGSVKY